MENMETESNVSSPVATLNVPDVTEPGQKASEETPGQHSTIEKEKTGPLIVSGQVRTVELMGVPIVALLMDGQERLCLAQISSTLLKQYSYNEIHNRRVALGITCVQCTPVQLEILRRAGAMPVSSRRCGMITKREAERLCKSFLTDNSPPKLPDNFTFDVQHRCAWGCRGKFMPSRYNSSRAKCVQCIHCRMFFSPNKFIFHSHRFADSTYTQPDAANFNSWRRHLHLGPEMQQIEHIMHAWEDVKAMFNGGTRKRFMAAAFNGQRHSSATRKVEDPPKSTSTNSSQKAASTSSNGRHHSASIPMHCQKKIPHPFPNPAFQSTGTNFYSSLYCSPLHFPQQFSLPDASWLCNSNPYSYAALAAAAAAQSTSNAPPCWFPYGPFIQPPITPLSAMASSSTNFASSSSFSNASQQNESSQAAVVESKMPDSAFNVIQAKESKVPPNDKGQSIKPCCED